MKEYKILSNQKFRKVNRKQKRQIVLSSLAAFTFLESSLITLAGSIYSFTTSNNAVGGLFLGTSVLTAVAAECCNLHAKNIDYKNNMLVNDQIVALKEKYKNEKVKPVLRR